MAVTFSVSGTTVTLTGALVITAGTLTGITDLTVADGGTGVSTLTDGGILLGSGTGAITAMDVLAAGELIYGDGTTDPAILAAGATTTILVGGGAAAPVWTTASGSGAPLRQTSPTMVTPVLGTPASGTLTNCTGYPSASDTVSGILEIATAAEQETGTDVVRAVTPGRQHRHPSAIKCFGQAIGTGASLFTSYNVTSITDTGTGILTVTIATDFTTNDYALCLGIQQSTAATAHMVKSTSQVSGSFVLNAFVADATDGAPTDPDFYYWICSGNQV